MNNMDTLGEIGYALQLVREAKEISDTLKDDQTKSVVESTGKLIQFIATKAAELE